MNCFSLGQTSSLNSPSILLLTLCTARAIRVTVRLVGFTRIHFSVRVLTLVTSLAIDTSPVSILWSVLGTWSLDTAVARDRAAQLSYRRSSQFAEHVGAASRRDCDRDDLVNVLYHWELHRLLAQVNQRQLSSQHGTTTPSVDVLDLGGNLSISTPELQALVIATQLHIHLLIRELQLVYLNRLLDLLDGRHRLSKTIWMFSTSCS